MRVRCERDFCGHFVDEHDREAQAHEATCRHCPCQHAIVEGKVVVGYRATQDAAVPLSQRPLFEATKAAMTDAYRDVVVGVDVGREGGDKTVAVVGTVDADGVRRVVRTIAESDAEREAILDNIEKDDSYTLRLSRARRIAKHLAGRSSDGTVTVAAVREEFIGLYGKQQWVDFKGHTYWAGAIFRDREEWEVCGTTKSPNNHNDSNRVWRLRKLKGTSS